MDIFNHKKIAELENKLAIKTELSGKIEKLQQNFGMQPIQELDLDTDFKKAKAISDEEFAHVSNLYRSAKEVAILLASMPNQVFELYFKEQNKILDIYNDNKMTAVYNDATSTIEYFHGFGRGCVWVDKPAEWVDYQNKRRRIFAIRSVIDEELPKRANNLKTLFSNLYEE